MTRDKLARDAVVRLRAASLDLIAVGRHTDAADVMQIVERIESPPRGEAAGSGQPAARAGRSDSATHSPASSGSATYKATPHDCGNCGHVMAAHCTTHLLPCCPGSLMHGQDEGTWTPAP